MASLCVQKSPVEPARIFVLAAQPTPAQPAVEYSLVFDSPADKAACENTVLMLQRTQIKPKEVGLPTRLKRRCWPTPQTLWRRWTPSWRRR